MTNRNSNSKTEYNEPFLLSPAGQDYLWGGHRLKDDFAKNLDLSPLAETWECSTHPNGMSTVMCGSLKGKTLQEVLREHPRFIGIHPQKNYPDIANTGDIPILVKFIDANQKLSVQVHPDDVYAYEHESGQLGKTEMWYVVDAVPGAKLIYGFNRDVDAQTIEQALADDSIEKYLQKVDVKRGDVFVVQPGTVHAICAGCLIVEVQESSNLTYRLYDYHRIDKDGRERALHTDKALQVMNFDSLAAPRQPMHLRRYQPGLASVLLCRCKYFEVEQLTLNTERVRNPRAIQTDETSFEVLVCTDGCGILFWTSHVTQMEHTLRFYKGDTIFLPANSVPMQVHGKAELLQVKC